MRRSNLLILVLLAGMVFTGPVAAEEGKKTKLPEEKRKLLDALRDLQDLYMDLHPSYDRITMLRKQGIDQSRFQSYLTSFRETVNRRLPPIKQTINGLNPGTRSFRNRVEEIRTSVIDLFEQFVKRFVNDWEPENPRKLAGTSPATRLEKGLAGPKLLRRAFLNRLAGQIRTFDRSKDRLQSTITRLESRVEPTYWSITEKFLEGVRKAEEARKQHEKSEREKDGKKGKPDTSKKETTPETESQTKTEKEKKNRKEQMDPALRARIRKLEQEWNRFIQENVEKVNDLLQSANRILGLYADRNGLYREERKRRRKLRAIKRRLSLVASLAEGDTPLTNENTTRRLVLDLSEQILKTYDRLLNEYPLPERVFSKLREAPDKTAFGSKAYQKRVKKYRKHIDLETGVVIGPKPIGDPVKRIFDVLDRVEKLAENLPELISLLEGFRDSGRSDERIRTLLPLLKQLEQITREAAERTRSNLQAQKRYYNTFINMNVENRKASELKKKFEKRVKKILKDVYGSVKEVPEPTIVQLTRQQTRLRKKISRSVR